MIEYLNGHIAGKSPAHVVLDLHGTGYWVNISLNTYVALADSEQVKLFIHEVIREDAHILYGFANHDERELFRMLVSVSGVGASTGILFCRRYVPMRFEMQCFRRTTVEKYKGVVENGPAHCG